MATDHRATLARIKRFDQLIAYLRDEMGWPIAAAGRAVNASLTLRNWLIGLYIVEYEQKGADRAQYGRRLVERLARALRRHRVPASDRPRLYAYVAFYRAYPQIAGFVP